MKTITSKSPCKVKDLPIGTYFYALEWNSGNFCLAIGKRAMLSNSDYITFYSKNNVNNRETFDSCLWLINESIGACESIGVSHIGNKSTIINDKLEDFLKNLEFKHTLPIPHLDDLINTLDDFKNFIVEKEIVI